MKIIFFGLNEIGESCLESLLNNRYDIDLVVASRLQRTEKMNALIKTNRLKSITIDDDFNNLRKFMKSRQTDLIIVASFDKILPKDIINTARLGGINIHPSLLPSYRGAHPLHWAIIHDENKVGVTIHYLDEKVDSGDILVQSEIPISNRDTINTLKKKVANKSAKLLPRLLRKIEASKEKLKGIKQNDMHVSFAPKRSPAQSKINWPINSRDIFNLVRAVKTPYPNAYTFTDKGEKILFMETFIPQKSGQVIAKYKEYYLVTSSDGVILIKTDLPLRIGQTFR